MILFGSRARGEAGLDVDIDVCLVLCPREREELELSQKKPEYLNEFELDVQIYQFP